MTDAEFGSPAVPEILRSGAAGTSHHDVLLAHCGSASLHRRLGGFSRDRVYASVTSGSPAIRSAWAVQCDSDCFVGFKPADVVQDGERLAAGDKTEGAFEAP
jgi:hypothetical protein